MLHCADLFSICKYTHALIYTRAHTHTHTYTAHSWQNDAGLLFKGAMLSSLLPFTHNAVNKNLFFALKNPDGDNLVYYQ